MLNPNDIANKKFDRSMGRGYKAEEVDRFLAQVANEMSELADEKQELEQKLMVLADKLEEYKRDEESLRAALLGAQKLGDSVVREAKAKAELLLEEAKAKANAMIDNAKQAIEKEKNAYVRMQREVATFKSKLQLLYKQHLELISSISVDESAFNTNASQKTASVPQEDPGAYSDPQESSAEEAPETAESNPDDGFETEPQMGEALEYTEQGLLEYTEEYSSEADRAPKRDSRFGPLKFGREFDMKRDADKRKK